MFWFYRLGISKRQINFEWKRKTLYSTTSIWVVENNLPCSLFRVPPLQMNNSKIQPNKLDGQDENIDGISIQCSPYLAFHLRAYSLNFISSYLHTTTLNSPSTCVLQTKMADLFWTKKPWDFFFFFLDIQLRQPCPLSFMSHYKNGGGDILFLSKFQEVLLIWVSGTYSALLKITLTITPMVNLEASVTLASLPFECGRKL